MNCWQSRVRFDLARPKSITSGQEQRGWRARQRDFAEDFSKWAAIGLKASLVISGAIPLTAASFDEPWLRASGAKAGDFWLDWLTIRRFWARTQGLQRFLTVDVGNLVNQAAQVFELTRLERALQDSNL